MELTQEEINILISVVSQVSLPIGSKEAERLRTLVTKLLQIRDGNNNKQTD